MQSVKTDMVVVRLLFLHLLEYFNARKIYLGTVEVIVTIDINFSSAI